MDFTYAMLLSGFVFVMIVSLIVTYIYMDNRYIKSQQIERESLTGDKLEDDTIDGSKLANLSVDTRHYQEGSITTNKLNINDDVNMNFYNLYNAGALSVNTDDMSLPAQIVNTENTGTSYSSIYKGRNSSTKANGFDVQVKDNETNIIATYDGVAHGSNLFLSTKNASGDVNKHVQVTPDGFVGVGVSDPEYPVAVNGHIQMTKFPLYVGALIKKQVFNNYTSTSTAPAGNPGTIIDAATAIFSPLAVPTFYTSRLICTCYYNWSGIGTKTDHFEFTLRGNSNSLLDVTNYRSIGVTNGGGGGRETPRPLLGSYNVMNDTGSQLFILQIQAINSDDSVTIDRNRVTLVVEQILEAGQ